MCPQTFNFLGSLQVLYFFILISYEKNPCLDQFFVFNLGISPPRLMFMTNRRTHVQKLCNTYAHPVQVYSAKLAALTSCLHVYIFWDWLNYPDQSYMQCFHTGTHKLRTLQPIHYLQTSAKV